MNNPFRLSQYSKGLFDALPSLAGIKKAIKSGALLVNGSVGQTGTWVQPGDVIELYDLEQKPPKIYQMRFEVVYEDEDMAVIMKPSGISVSGNQFRCIENALSYNVKLSNKANALKWPRPVHRLDNPTSGLLLVSKTSEAHIALGRMFENKTIRKEYHAIVMGETNANGSIRIPIDRQTAVTHYELIKSVNSVRSGKLSLLKLKPETGRTHQIRIHCSQSGFPILGDKIYGPEGNTLLHRGLYLCANRLHFIHPISGVEMDVHIELPNKFVTRLANEARMFLKYQQG